MLTTPIVKSMGVSESKEWTPKADFRYRCRTQGFIHTSPPICITNDIVITVDMDENGDVYCVERYTEEGLLRRNVKSQHIYRRYAASLQKNHHSESITIMYKKETEFLYYLLQLQPNGDLHVSSNSGTQCIQESLYNHPNFPKFTTTGHKEYDILGRIFNETYGVLIDTP